MQKVKRIIWRSSQDHKDLVSVEQGKIVCHPYELTRAEVDELIRALEEVLELTEPEDPNTPPEVRTV